MIDKLKNSEEDVAQQIYTVFQNSYKVEAQLIGVTDFPPLLRSKNDIQSSINSFYGYREDGCLAAVVEFSIQDNQLDIESFTVDPAFFRKGIAGKLLSYVLSNVEFETATVETAVVNEPAINLYEKYGFVAFKRWTPAHGIKKIALSLVKPSRT